MSLAGESGLDLFLLSVEYLDCLEPLNHQNASKMAKFLKKHVLKTHKFCYLLIFIWLKVDFFPCTQHHLISINIVFDCARIFWNSKWEQKQWIRTVGIVLLNANHWFGTINYYNYCIRIFMWGSMLSKRYYKGNHSNVFFKEDYDDSEHSPNYLWLSSNFVASMGK